MCIISLILQVRKLRNATGNKGMPGCMVWSGMPMLKSAWTLTSCCSLGHIPHLPVHLCPLRQGGRETRIWVTTSSHRNTVCTKNTCKAFIKYLIHPQCYYHKRNRVNQDRMKQLETFSGNSVSSFYLTSLGIWNY